MQTLVPYTVSVKTSDLRGSDFEGEAFIKINGYDACTEWMKLVKEVRARRRGEGEKDGGGGGCRDAG